MDIKIPNVVEMIDTYKRTQILPRRKNVHPLPEKPPKEEGKGDKVDIYI